MVRAGVIMLFPPNCNRRAAAVSLVSHRAFYHPFRSLMPQAQVSLVKAGSLVRCMNPKTLSFYWTLEILTIHLRKVYRTRLHNSQAWARSQSPTRASHVSIMVSSLLIIRKSIHNASFKVRLNFHRMVSSGNTTVPPSPTMTLSYPPLL